MARRSANQRTSTPAAYARAAAPPSAASGGHPGGGAERGVRGARHAPGCHTAVAANGWRAAATMGGVSDLKDRLRTDLTTSIKARDACARRRCGWCCPRSPTPRWPARSSASSATTTSSGVLSTEAKKRREAADRVRRRRARRSAAKERAEADVIAEYLPAQLSEAEISDLVTSTIASLGVAGDGMRAMGKVMGALQPQVKGRADGGAVSAEVRRQLG